MAAQMKARKLNRRGCRGGCVVEMALIMPWYFFLFAGTFDWGYYAHALVSAQAAARTAAMYTSQSSTTAVDQSTACTYALNEMKIAANVNSSLTCTSSPLIVSTSLVTASSSPDGSAKAASVTVKYLTLPLIPIPKLLAQQFWIVQTVEMRLQS